MLSLSTNAISTKAKAMYGRRLRLNNYTELMHKRNIAEIVSYLKQETDYKDILKDVRDNSIHRQQLEELLKQDLFEKGLKLMRYATSSDLEFYKYEVYEIEIDLILNKLTQLINEDYDTMKFISSIPMFMKKYTHFDMMNLAKATSYLEVAKCIKSTPYANILKPYLVDKTTMNFHKCEILLKKFYYDLIDKMIDKYYKKSLNKDLKSILYSGIELSNIIKIYRMKKFFNASSEEIKASLIDFHFRIPLKELNRMIEDTDATEFMKALESSNYKMFSDEKDYVYIEYYADKIRYHLGERFMNYSNSAPSVYTSYMQLHKLEIANITNIIEGIRYGMSVEEMEKLLII